MLIRKKIEERKKNSFNFFKSLRPFPLKFNDPEPISKQLTMLINVNNWKSSKDQKKILRIFLKVWGNFSSNLITLKELASN